MSTHIRDRRQHEVAADWDISRTEQRTARPNGDKARWYPYENTQAQVFAEQD